MQEALLTDLYQHCQVNCPADHVLLIEDTTELNYDSHNGRFKVNDPDLGVLSDDTSTGLFVHPCLVVEAQSGFPVGYSHLALYQHGFDRWEEAGSKQAARPLAAKESFRWLNGPAQSRAVLSAARQITVIADREGDIYQVMARLAADGMDFVIRSHYDRQVDQGQKLSEALEAIPWQAETHFEVSETKKRPARKVQAQLRWKQVQLHRPKNTSPSDREGYPEQMAVYVVELQEMAQSVPEGQAPVHWRIWTTHPVASSQAALQIIQWYQQRWWIEELFRLIKTKGFQIESAQLSTGAALKKMIILTLEQALKVLMLKHNRNHQLPLMASRCFDPEELLCLEALASQVEGRSKKQQNPFPLLSLAWAAWIIGRLGGWTQDDMNKRPPGVISYLRGLRRFKQTYQGFVAARKHFGQPPP